MSHAFFMRKRPGTVTMRSSGVMTVVATISCVATLYSLCGGCVEASLPFNTNLLVDSTATSEKPWRFLENPDNIIVQTTVRDAHVDITFDDHAASPSLSPTPNLCRVEHVIRPASTDQSICDNCLVLIRGRMSVTFGPVEGVKGNLEYPGLHYSVMLDASLGLGFHLDNERLDLSSFDAPSLMSSNGVRSYVYEKSIVHIQNIPRAVRELILSLRVGFYRHSYVQFNDLEVILMESTPALPLSMERTPIPYHASLASFPNVVANHERTLVQRVHAAETSTAVRLLEMTSNRDASIDSIAFGGNFMVSSNDTMLVLQLNCAHFTVELCVEKLERDPLGDIAKHLSYVFQVPQMEGDVDILLTMHIEHTYDHEESNDHRFVPDMAILSDVFATVTYASTASIPGRKETAHQSVGNDKTVNTHGLSSEFLKSRDDAHLSDGKRDEYTGHHSLLHRASVSTAGAQNLTERGKNDGKAKRGCARVVVFIVVSVVIAAVLLIIFFVCFWQMKKNGRLRPSFRGYGAPYFARVKEVVTEGSYIEAIHDFNNIEPDSQSSINDYSCSEHKCF